MRQIKFRGLRTDGGGWVYGYYFGGYNWADFIIEDAGFEHRVRVMPETVGQFTGLKDKNGKEIYEGDVLSIEIVDEDSVSGSSDFYTGAVIYGRDYKSTNKGKVTSYPCSFTIHCNDWYMEEGLLGMNNHDVEIIGNIHEEGGQDV